MCWCGSSVERPPVYVSSNPLRGLPALPKPHYSWPLPGLFLADVGHADGVLVDFARVTHSIPLDLTYMAGQNKGWEMVAVAVEACHRAGPNCTLAINYSPWQNWPNANDEPDPTLRGAAEEAELAHFRTSLSNTTHWIRVANAELGANVRVGALLLDSEIFEADYWFPPSYYDAVSRKHELIYNCSISAFPKATTLFYAYGAAHRITYRWGGPEPPKPDPLRRGLPAGWRRDNRFTLREHLGGSPFTTELYSVPEQQEMRELFKASAALATSLANGPGPSPSNGLVVPWLALGCGYRRAIESCTQGPLCSAVFDTTWNYDEVYSYMLGAEINLPWYANHAADFAPWDKAPVVLLYPGPFDYRGVQLPSGTTSMMSHFVAYLKGAGNISSSDRPRSSTLTRPARKTNVVLPSR
eukprot:SAG31_NODE_236_length_19594_cov_7.018620_5_plen_412_part_00